MLLSMIIYLVQQTIQVSVDKMYSGHVDGPERLEKCYFSQTRAE